MFIASLRKLKALTVLDNDISGFPLGKG